MPGNPESSYSPAASGAGPPFRVIKAQTLIDGVPTIVDLEVITIADKDGNLLDMSDMETVLNQKSKVFKDIRKYLKEIARDPESHGRVTDDLALMVDNRRAMNLEFAPFDTSASGNTVVIKARPKTKIKVCSYVIVAAGTVTAQWKSVGLNSTKSDNLSGVMALSANGGVSSPAGTPGSWLMEAADDLVLSLGGAIQVGGHIAYFREP